MTSLRRRIQISMIALAAASLATLAPAQQAPVNGMRPADLRAHAITNATVVTQPGETIENATIVIRDGVIESVGANVTPPPDARTWDGEGLTVYAGLIDAAVLVKTADPPKSVGDHWNPKVHPQLTLAAQSAPSESERKQLRELGFAAAAVYPEDGIFRGTGVVVGLASETGHVLAYRERAAMAVSFDRGGGGWTNPVYPGSLMGSIALIRQTLLDAQWHAQNRRVWEQHPEGNEPPIRADALEALDDVLARRQTVLFDVNDEHNALRAAAVAHEFNLDMMLLGSGYEFRRLPEIVALGMPVIVPLQYPKRPDLSTLAQAERVTLRDMMTWEQAPTNARRLVDAGADIALTTHRLKKRSDFPAAARKAIQHGLTEDEALAALTTAPAKLLGVDHLLGTIEPGKVANLVVVEGSLFDKERTIRDVWINGRRHEVESAPTVELVTKGALVTDDGLNLDVKIDTKKKSFAVMIPAPEAPATDPAAIDGADETDAAGESSPGAEPAAKPKTKTVKAKKVVVQQDQISAVIDGEPFGDAGYVRLSGALTGGTVTGLGVRSDGDRFQFTITPGPEDETTDDEAADDADEPESGDADTDADDDGVSGRWDLALDMDEMPQPLPVSLSLELGNDGRLNGRLGVMGNQVELQQARFDRETGQLSATVQGPDGNDGQLVATISGGSLSGTVQGGTFAADLSGTRSGGGNGDDDEAFEMPPDELVYPLGAYGLPEPPRSMRVVIENATIWTCGPQGIIENGQMYIEDGKIVDIGTNVVDKISRTDLLEIDDAGLYLDVNGRHITPGLIDCHSHTGIDGGVNEFAQTNTAEVRIGDVVDPDDIGWYRELAGGLTAVNQLHGSANPIGGQNSVVKLKWSRAAADYRIADAIAGIKFALGENVKRSENRYPNTRMGVETFIRDAFTAARDYRDAWDRYLALPTLERERTMMPRRDLELDALVEILEGARLIHCHSYRQDEILMLIRLADEFGFTIGTFQHVLEGYKVADAIAAHGAGASSFSDWWAYKVEVMDAIPYNGSLMTDIGVNVSFNSDSNELARRMNTEAAKAVRYGGLDPHAALMLVTANPAKQLRIDGRTGSLQPGKDADFVIWSAEPLSTYARCEQTWIEGARYFDRQTDADLRANAASERQRLIQKILAQAHGKLESAEDEPGSAVTAQVKPTVAAVPEAWQRWAAEQVRLGYDPEELSPADCGCGFLDMAHGHE
jgi:N-acetylglucosamine-6-phosphate deacetylase